MESKNWYEVGRSMAAMISTNADYKAFMNGILDASLPTHNGEIKAATNAKPKPYKGKKRGRKSKAELEAIGAIQAPVDAIPAAVEPSNG